MKIRHQIKRLAWRRFILGYPPRKGKDNSIGDAMNWEWFIHCANELQGKFLIVSRDSDYGIEYRDMPFLNDALKAEFRDRVGKKSILYTTKLSDALKYLEVTVSREEEESEDAQLESTSRSTTGYAALKKVYDDISLLQTSMGVERPSKAWRNLLEQTTPAADAIKRFREQMKVLEENFAPSIEAINKLREQHPELFVKPKGADETDS
jgi:hypothetical protein